MGLVKAMSTGDGIAGTIHRLRPGPVGTAGFSPIFPPMGLLQISPAVLADRQNGIISVADAGLCGYNDADVDRFCRRNEWTRMRRGLYHPFPPPGPEQRMLLEFAAALRAIQIKDAAIAGISAARLWGAQWLHEPGFSDVWVACDVPGKPRYYPGLRVLPAAFPAEDLTRSEGLPVSTPARTAVDLARHLSFDPAVVAIESLRYRYAISDGELAGVLARCRGWPYIRRARRAIEFSGASSESPLESKARLAFYYADVPPYRQQVEFIDAYGVRRRVDFLFGRRSGVETDGRVKYRTPEDLWKEKRRTDGLNEAGVALLRLGASDLRVDPRALRRRIIDHMSRAGDWIDGVGPVPFE